MNATNMPAGHDHSAHAPHGSGGHVMLDCQGNVMQHAGGTWMGHVLPGITFCLWGSWWAYNVVAAYLFQARHRPYAGRAWYPLAARGLFYIEPVLKLLVPAVAISIELYFDHNFQFQHLYCQEGTKLAGAFDSSNMNNWQHTASYPGIVLSGLTDFVSLFVPLPPGTSQAVLALGWSTMSFLMVMHEKHEPQDKMVHWLLFVAMCLVALMLWLDLALRRRSVLAGLGRALAVIFQGAWLIQVGVIEFKGKPQWRVDPPFSGSMGAMMAPVAFTSILLTCAAALLGFYCLVGAGKQAGLLTPARMGLALDAPDPEEVLARAQLGELYSLSHSHHHYDSARASDDSDDADGLLDSAGRHHRPGGGGGAHTPAAFHIDLPGGKGMSYV